MTSLPDVSSGATWCCVDLHLHLHHGKQLQTLLSGLAEKLGVRHGRWDGLARQEAQLGADAFRPPCGEVRGPR